MVTIMLVFGACITVVGALFAYGACVVAARTDAAMEQTRNTYAAEVRQHSPRRSARSSRAVRAAGWGDASVHRRRARQRAVLTD